MGSLVGTLLITMVLVIVAVAAAPWPRSAGEREAMESQGPAFPASEYS